MALIRNMHSDGEGNVGKGYDARYMEYSLERACLVDRLHEIFVWSVYVATH